MLLFNFSNMEGIVVMPIVVTYVNFVAVLPKLLPLAVGTDLHTRHGAILACAEITLALKELAEENKR